MKLNSLSLFVGTGKCNAYCGHCAGIIHRKYAPKEDGIIDEKLISQTLRDCYQQGARSLSISSSGEPTLSPLSVTKTLELVDHYRQEGMAYSPINLYSNGIRIGQEEQFCQTYLPKWKDLGLTTIYITVHSIDEKKNAQIYGVKNYPSLPKIISRIHQEDLLMRANLVLSQKTIKTKEDFVSTVTALQEMDADMISAWRIRNEDDQVDPEQSPLETELNQMEKWVEDNPHPRCKIRLLKEQKQAELYQTGQKLTLFPDGNLSNTWCNNSK